jgi:HSP20 family protein
MTREAPQGHRIELDGASGAGASIALHRRPDHHATQEDVMAEKAQETARREETRLANRESQPGPRARTLERLGAEMDRLFDVFGIGRGWLAPLPVPRWARAGVTEAWSPDAEMFQRNNELVIRTDLPGLTKDDVKVDITEDAVTIQGERKWEHEEERRGFYRSERSYGSFYRMIPLPEGAISDQAKATFKNGVLEITMPAPPESVKAGRRIDIA